MVQGLLALRRSPLDKLVELQLHQWPQFETRSQSNESAEGRIRSLAISTLLISGMVVFTQKKLLEDR